MGRVMRYALLLITHEEIIRARNWVAKQAWAKALQAAEAHGKSVGRKEGFDRAYLALKDSPKSEQD